MIYVLAYPSFDPLPASRIAAIRAKHEPQRAKLVPPHITLVFGVSTVYLQDLSRLVDVVAKTTRAFPVAFDSYESQFDPFEKTHKVFLLCGKGRETLTSLHTQLYEGPHRSEFSASHPFTPHMTVATHKTRAVRLMSRRLGIFRSRHRCPRSSWFNWTRVS